MRHRRPMRPGRVARLLAALSLRQRDERPADVVVTTLYRTRDGQPRGSYGHQADHTMILQNRPLLTRGQAWRADHAMRNQMKGGYR